MVFRWSVGREQACASVHRRPSCPLLPACLLQYQTTIAAIEAVNPSITDFNLVQPGTLLNIPPFAPSCAGQGNLVDVAGSTTVPSTYTYNGVANAARWPPRRSG